MNADHIMSDKFVEFSQKVSALHETKKKLSAELKKTIEDGKASLKKIDDEAAVLLAEFTAWQEQQKAK
jgi:hypothetical protein